MAKKKPEDPAKTKEQQAQQAQETDAAAENAQAAQPEAPAPEMIEKDVYLRLAAEYDNFRKRSQKEKESTYSDAKANTLTALLPVYDNLERALKNPCSDEAYKKGVEMTMTQLEEIFKKLGVEEIPAEGCPFDASVHNAVMHIEDEAFGENTVAECFQKGFKLGGRIMRFAMVKVAN